MSNRRKPARKRVCGRDSDPGDPVDMAPVRNGGDDVTK
jgi:hypothetical protein